MQKTERLFDKDSELAEFEARVLSCDARESGGFAVILDKTAFFPNEGGQSSDPGELGGARVLSVDEESGVIIHTLAEPLDVGATVVGRIDFQARFKKMQCHTAEHIVSGIIHRRFGYDNVGFHLGKDDMTADFNGELDESELRAVEDEANTAVFACRNIRAYYPAQAELERLEYRSKSGLEGDVRIVEIEGVDACACCAPHVKNTGAVGLVRIVECIRYKGGVRLHIRAGFDALEDYRARCAQIRAVSVAISAKQDAIAEGVDRMLEEMGALRGKLAQIRREKLQARLKELEGASGAVCLFESIDDAVALRNFVNAGVKLVSGVCAVFSGEDGSGYRFIIGSETQALKPLAERIRAELGGKCGGSDVMIQGTTYASRAEIERFFKNV